MSMRVLVAVVVAVGSVGGTSVAAAAEGRASGRPQRVDLVGCVAQTADGGFELSNAMRASLAPRTGGSNSAKASTPVGGDGPTVDRPRTSGTGTAKGSAPISVVPASLTLSATSGANSAKASTPVAHKPTSYALADANADVASLAGHAVEVIGVLEQRVLKVETVRPVAGSCAQ